MEGLWFLHRIAALIAIIAFCLLLDTLPLRLGTLFFLILCGFVTSFKIPRSVGVYFSISLITELHLKFRKVLGSLLRIMELDLFEHIT